MGKRLLEVQDLKTHFIREKSVVKAIDGVSFYVDENETLGLVGESGSGKSISSLSILRLVPKPGRVVGGRIIFEGQDLLALSEKQMRELRGRAISMILQDPMTSLNPVFNVGDQIGESIATHFKVKGADLLARVVEMLRLVKIPSPETRVSAYPHQMSGGMKQRIAGAISISCRPRLLIADEPTTSLDVTIQQQYLNLLLDIQKRENLALIFITHDLGIVAKMCHRVVVMYAGHVVEKGDVREIFYHSLHPYTRALLNSVPKMEEKVKRLYNIEGQPPSLLNLPPGCNFLPRCTEKTGKCSSEEYPPEVEVSPNHIVRCWQHV